MFCVGDTTRTTGEKGSLTGWWVFLEEIEKCCETIGVSVCRTGDGDGSSFSEGIVLTKVEERGEILRF